MQSLKHGNIIATLGHVAGKRKSGRPRAYNSYHDAVALRTYNCCFSSRRTVEVGGKTLQISYRNRLLLHLMIYTSALTLFFLRTHTAAYRRESRCLFKHPGRLTEFATLYILYESGDVDSHRATGDTLRVGTVHASGSLDYGGFRGKSTVDFLIACNTVSRIKFRHLHTRNRRALLGRAGLAQILAPQGVTRRYGCRHIIFL